MGVTLFSGPQVHPWSCLTPGGEGLLLGTGGNCSWWAAFMEHTLEGGGILQRVQGHSVGVGRLALVDSKGGWRALGLAAVFVTLG